MDQRAPQKDQILSYLDSLVSRMMVQAADFSDLDYRIYPGSAAGRSFVIEVSKGRYSQSVVVDPLTVQRIEKGQSDPNLNREVRVAMLTVLRLAEERK